MRQDILVVGSINIDFNIKTKNIPLPGQNVFGEKLQIVPGGKGANQAVGIAKLGHDVLLAGKIGKDYFGNYLVKKLKENRVSTKYIELDNNESTGTTIILIDSNGENSIVISTGANGRFSKESVEKIKRVIGKVKIVLLQLELPLEQVGQVIDIANEFKKTIILDAGPQCRKPLLSFFKVDILTPNKIEAEALSDMPIENITSMARVSEYFLSKGTKIVVLKLGNDGCFLATTTLKKHFPIFKDVKVVDTTAAGDAFTAALAVGVLEGKSIEETVTYANAAGSLAVTKIGAQSSLPTKKDLEVFINEEVK